MNEITETWIENACDDLKDALSDLLENGPNVHDYDRVDDAIGQLSAAHYLLMGDE